MEETKKGIQSEEEMGSKTATAKIVQVKTEIDVAGLIAKVEALEKKDADNQGKLKMLYEVADKGRVMSYENKVAIGRKPTKVKLSIRDGDVVIGWRTVKDVLIKHPTTGLTVGEEQQYEVILLDKEGKTKKITVDGYPAFSDLRYAERIEVEVIGKKEDYLGNIAFSIRLPDDRVIDLDSRFIN